MCQPRTPDSEPSLDDVVNEALVRVALALQRAKRVSTRGVLEMGGLKLTLACKRMPTPKAKEDDTDLPAEVARESKATRRVYRTLVALRAKVGEGAAVWPQDIERAIRVETPDDDLSNRTVFRALKRLRAIGRVAYHPDRGYRLGPDRPPLPFCG